MLRCGVWAIALWVGGAPTPKRDLLHQVVNKFRFGVTFNISASSFLTGMERMANSNGDHVERGISVPFHPQVEGIQRIRKAECERDKTPMISRAKI